MQFERYVAIGDSQSEGLNDHDGTGGYRGWADRFAGHLATVNPSVRYANLAVRGKLSRQILEEQLEPALALKPDLVSVMAGLNDTLRSSFVLEDTVANLETMIAALCEAGAHFITNTYPDIGRIAPVARRLVPRITAYNAAIRSVGQRHGATVVDFEASDEAVDRRIWSDDRIHANALGHERMAFAFAQALDLPGLDEAGLTPLPTMPSSGPVATLVSEAKFVRTFLVPWLVRRARGRSSGDGITAKRPELMPVELSG